MSGYRAEIEASAGPARRRRVGGGGVLLVRVRVFDEPDLLDTETGEPAALPEAFTDLDPRDARTLAIRLLAAADDAEQRTLQANYWEPQR
jgi:hypothetical protein